ncbi:MAG: NAD(P)/FAD-dependent oxidoreductase [Clostridia bacterium]|nr:NAD(P)/FAD-dependent oxidoreductase [Clostridia bacterium]
MNIKKINKKLQKAFGGKFTAVYENGAVSVRGESGDWGEIVSACMAAATKNSTTHVVNDAVFTGAVPEEMRLPAITDSALDGKSPDVLIIGGGISGASIARELTKWKLDVLLIEKEADLALGASGRNDGEVHPGVDLGKGSLKHKYVRRGNRMYGDVCRELNVGFRRVGQYVGFLNGALRPLIGAYCLLRKYRDGIEDTEIISGKELHRREPNLNHAFKFAISNPSTGCVCPYGLTIAYAENAVQNGARVSLSTAALGMDVQNGEILSVCTNRGTVYPRLVINAAGVFAEEIAKMADDRFYSIHPRRGTNSILDKKAGVYMHSVSSVKELPAHDKSHSKGGGILHTVHDNLLVGPDAVETYEKENYATNADSIKTVFDKQTVSMPGLSKSDIITYFTGVRAPTFEEDFIIEKGRRTKNLIHCAGIQSPGLTTAPAVALDIEKMAVEMLSENSPVEKNEAFDPIRKGVPVLRDMPDDERAEMIRQNPDYGVIVCRCEEVSKGEILDALRSPICVPTVDGVKKRVRPGMGRCQGGFCSPLVVKIIAEFLGVPPEDVRKSADSAVITYGKTKGGADDETV